MMKIRLMILTTSMKRYHNQSLTHICRSLEKSKETSRRPQSSVRGQTPVVILILSRKGALVALAGAEVEDMVEVMEEVDMEEDSAVMVEGIRIADMEVDTKVTKREEVEEKIFSTFPKCFRI